jgi:hypothetical protein
LVHKEWLQKLIVQNDNKCEIDKLLVARMKGKLHLIQEGNFSYHIGSPFLNLLTVQNIHSTFSMKTRDLVNIPWNSTICRCNFVVLMWFVLGSDDYSFVMKKPKPSTLTEFNDQVSVIDPSNFREFKRLQNLMENEAIKTFEIVILSDMEKNLMREIDRSMNNSRQRLKFMLKLFECDLNHEKSASKS